MVAPAKSRKEPSRQPASTDNDTRVINTMDHSTEALIRRVLCPQTHTTLTESQPPLHQLLPPLTSSNAVDIQLYAIIAIVMRDFVYSWYGKISTDQVFVEETLQIIAHCTRELEGRLRQVDLDLLLLHEIPEIVELHIKAFRSAHSQQAIPDSSCPEILYHTLFPHTALSPAPEHGLSTVEQVKNESAYRQLLVQGVLAVILPTEDLRNPCLRTLVTDVIADMILGNGIGGKASSGWLMWDGIVKALDHNDEITLHHRPIKDELKHNSKTRLEEFGLLPSRRGRDTPTSMKESQSSTSSAIFWRILQYLYMSIIGFRYMLVGLWTASRGRSSNGKPLEFATKGNNQTSPMTTMLEAPSRNTSIRRPVLTYSIFGLLSQLLELESRVPWIVGVLSLIRHHLVDGFLHVGATEAVLDKFLHDSIQQQLRQPSLLPQILQTVRNGIFPNNVLGPARSVPSIQAQRQIKRQAANAILNKVPRAVASLYFGKSITPNTNTPSTGLVDDGTVIKVNAGAKSADQKASLPSPTIDAELDLLIPNPDAKREAQLQDIEHILDLFSNQYMNKHMLYSVIELVIVRLVPEVRAKSVRELLEERLGTLTSWKAD